MKFAIFLFESLPSKATLNYTSNAMLLLEKLTLKSGPAGSSQPLEFVPANVTVFVGPNHSGKSLLLGEIADAIRMPEKVHARKVLNEISFTPWTQSQKEEIAKKLRAEAHSNHPDQISLPSGHLSQEFGRAHFEHILKSIPMMRDVSEHPNIRAHFLNNAVLQLGGAKRLTILESTKREPPKSGYYVHILSRLFYTDEKRKVVQNIIKNSLDINFVIDPLGELFEARISESEAPPNIERSLADEAVEFYRHCKNLNEMSDGVRAFCGMIAAVVSSNLRVILIDEPEAFLHPALCVNLAKELCRLARENDTQLFISTHSAAFLLGCVQAGVNLNIARLTYRKGSATSRLLPQEELVPLMRQPLLRSIGALTGIFYNSVIVTESDSDRAFYDEINHRLLNIRDKRGIENALFLNAQNWQTTSRIVAPLRKLGIAVAAIIDIDFLLEGNSQAFQLLMESAGMPPSSRTSLGQLRSQLHSIVKPISAELKTKGIECVSNSDRLDLQNFIDQLAKFGVFAVPVGELERWLPNLSRKNWNGKSEWLLHTFEAMGENSEGPDYLHPEENDVWSFCGEVQRWLFNPQRAGMPLPDA